ncbi:carbonic anhydrase-related protein 10 [Nephila pilipes]|uniref:Carbonic anhydrase-related protein 10 n=1 Tax=Nephila pilipes TaxID=299642 RepID=A0A8X6NC67_NEPPI|nr:carbonic anhydrase-related protein 10 [Nephila pilipes]
MFMKCFGTKLSNFEFIELLSPDFWGLLNLEWSLCSKGRRQSPVNIDPATLLFDPSLRNLHVDKIRVNGVITNTGHGVIFRTFPATHSEILNITGGPLSYKYRFSEIHIHFARSDEKGSEHLISGYQFPAELQIYGYNSDLYQNITEAMSLQKNQGLVGISVLLQTGDLSNSELRILTSQLHKIIHRGQEAPLKYLSLRDLLPDTPHYMTYEGSTTMPGCYETVTWIVMNKPIYITKQQLFALRRLMQGDEKNPKAPLADNFRPTLELNQRSIRTNIDFARKPGSECPSMQRRVSYQVLHLKKNLGAGRNIGDFFDPVERKRVLVALDTAAVLNPGPPTSLIASKHRDRDIRIPIVASDAKTGHNVHSKVNEFCPVIIVIVITCLFPSSAFQFNPRPFNRCLSSFVCFVVLKFLSTHTRLLDGHKSVSKRVNFFMDQML